MSWPEELLRRSADICGEVRVLEDVSVAVMGCSISDGSGAYETAESRRSSWWSRAGRCTVVDLGVSALSLLGLGKLLGSPSMF